MNKKLILLMLILPLVLLFSIFTTSNAVSIKSKVPVSKIEIVGNPMIYLDYDINEKYFVNYAIYPVSAANKEVLFSTEPVGNQKYAELAFVDGYIVPKTTGVAKVYISTVDGGFKDSFIVKVDSLKVQQIECAITQSDLKVGDRAEISTTFSPNDVANKILQYTSSDRSVATVDDKGVVRAIGKGTAIIKVVADGNPNAFDTIVVNVTNQHAMDLAQTEIYTLSTEGEIDISIDTDDLYELSYVVYDLFGNSVTDAFDSATKFVNNNFVYKFNNDFYGTVVVKIKMSVGASEYIEKSCTIHRVNEVTASFDSEDVLSVIAGSPFALHNRITVNPSNANYRYEVEVSNDNIEVAEISNRIRLNAVLPGVTTITLKVIVNTPPYQTVTLTKDVVVLPSDMAITEQAKTYGIENIWTIGRYEASGGENTSTINLSLGKTTFGRNFEENFVYTTSSDKVTVSKNGLIRIWDDNFEGLVTITGKFEYENISKTTEPFTIRCIGKGKNVRSFFELYNATNNNEIVVLQKSIKEDFGKDINGDNVFTESKVTKINSTYDTTHYKNINKLDEAKIKILISFREDVYGNGYQINAHNVAYGLDSTGQLKSDALFKGPLNFVSMSESSSSLVSVKAQDNVSFAVYKDVTLNNVILSSCDIQADKDGNYDLTDLTYVGTTVEVFGDNVNIDYCRINNGRTVLRVFGDVEDSSRVINVNVKNSVLSSAREFILRMGTNAFVDGTVETPSPYLDNVERQFPMQKTYQAMTTEQKQDYDNKYIKTFVNIKNSILKDAGLFCIGVDSHFSGSALASGAGLAGGIVESWYDLAKTSYGAKLTFEGDVRMYDWKDVDTVDSSTLIEVIGSTSFSDLSFDVRELINSLATDNINTQFNTIVHKQGDKTYVHGGIAMFGGGKNYGVFETKNYKFKALNGYTIGLSDVNKHALAIAAGQEDFYFLLNDSTTSGFLPDDQARILNSSDAYSPIYLA